MLSSTKVDLSVASLLLRYHWLWHRTGVANEPTVETPWKALNEWSINVSSARSALWKYHKFMWQNWWCRSLLWRCWMTWWLSSLKPTNCTWKLGGWKMNFLLGFRPIFKGVLLEVPKPQVEMVEKEAGKKIACGFEENCSRWWVLDIFYVHLPEGPREKWSNLRSICFKWVGSTTNDQCWLEVSQHSWDTRKLVRYQRSLFRPRRRLLKCHRHNFTRKNKLRPQRP